MHLLDQRELVNTGEYIGIKELLHISNNTLGSICFVHYTDNILSGNTTV